MPLSVRLAAYLYFATAAISGLLAVVLIAISRLPWPFLFILIAFDGIPIWLGISLLQPTVDLGSPSLGPADPTHNSGSALLALNGRCIQRTPA